MFMLLAATIVQAQTVSTYPKGDLCITQCTDVATNNQYAFYNYDLTIQDDCGNGISITIMLSPKIEQNIINYQSLYVETLGLQKCYQGFKIILTLENNNKLELDSYNGYNCNGYFYCCDDAKVFKELSKQKLLSITVINVSHNETLTILVPGEKQKYFMEAYQVLKTSCISSNC